MRELILAIEPNGNVIKDFKLNTIDKEMGYEQALFDFEIVYDDDFKVYCISFETLIKFDNRNDCLDYIFHIYDELEKYMSEKKIPKKVNTLSLYEIYAQGINVNTKFKSIADIHNWLRFTITGFCGNDGWSD